MKGDHIMGFGLPGIGITKKQQEELGKLLENIIYVTDPEKIDAIIKLLYSIDKKLERLINQGGDNLHD